MRTTPVAEKARNGRTLFVETRGMKSHAESLQIQSSFSPVLAFAKQPSFPRATPAIKKSSCHFPTLLTGSNMGGVFLSRHRGGFSSLVRGVLVTLPLELV